ncbi:hypothetical protein F4774DRAFT_427165 [Daldinia eschscholtzii]|nr:hypothetical protein F4774DRAFT_427165 [Daldinia eschscholtzii]
MSEHAKAQQPKGRKPESERAESRAKRRRFFSALSLANSSSEADETDVGILAGHEPVQGDVAGPARHDPVRRGGDTELELGDKVYQFESFPDENSPLFNLVLDELTAEIAQIPEIALTANNLATPDDDVHRDDEVPYNDEFPEDGAVPPRLHPNLRQFLNSASDFDRVARAFYYVCYVARFGPIPCTEKFHERTMRSCC